jgi:hypothetical protein
VEHVWISLKVLLPAAKEVYQKQEEEKDSTKAATELHDKQELLQQQKKLNQTREMQWYCT